MEDFYRERSATIEMTSRNVELLNRRNAFPEKRHSSTGTVMTDNEGIEKSLHSSISPLRFSKLHENGGSPHIRSRGAVPRRSGSCSSSSSSSTRSSLEQALSHSRSSPSKIYFNNSTAANDHRKSLPELENIKGGITSSYSPRSKVSSPAQTEYSWTKFGSSQTENMVTNRLRRTSSSGSRSSSLSSASKLSSSSSSSLSPRYSPVDGRTSPCVSPQPGIEGLTLVQRTEIVLRVNATTFDVASQTETLDKDNSHDVDDNVSLRHSTKNQIFTEPRKKLPEEIECEELSRDLANQLGPNDKLVPILGESISHYLYKQIIQLLQS